MSNYDTSGLPTFIAVPARSWQEQTQPILRLQAIVILADVIQRYVLTLGVGFLQQKGQLPAKLLSDQSFSRAICEPTLGGVNVAIGKLNKHLTSPDDSDWKSLYQNYMTHLSPLIIGNPAIRESVTERAQYSLTALRNERLAHSLGLSDTDAQQLLDDPKLGWEKRLQDFLENSQWLKNDVYHCDRNGSWYQVNGEMISPITNPPTQLSSGDNGKTVAQIGNSWVDLRPLFAAEQDKQVTFAQVWLRAYNDHLLFQTLNAALQLREEADSLHQLFLQLLDYSGSYSEPKKEALLDGKDRLELVKIAADKLFSSQINTDALFWLGGPVGIGKSALMRKVISEAPDEKKRKLIFMPFRRSRADDAIRDFILSQLPELARWIRQHWTNASKELPDLPFPREMLLLPTEELCELFARTVKAVRGLRNVSPRPVLVLVFDGTDELAVGSADAPKELAWLAKLAQETAGDNVRWAFAGRNLGWTEKLFASEHFKPLLQQRNLPPMTQDDMHAMLYNGLTTNKQTELLALQTAQQENPFLQAVYQHAEGYPSYVQMILHDLVHGKISIDDKQHQLPSGTQDFIDQKFESFALLPGTQTQLITSFLVVLAIKRERLSLQELHEWANYLSSTHSTEEEARQAVGQIRPLLETDRISTDPKYMLHHEGLRETILNPTYKRFASMVQGYREKISQVALNPFAGDVPGHVRDTMLRNGLREMVDDAPDTESRRRLAYAAAKLLNDFKYHADRLRITGAEGLADLLKDLETIANEIDDQIAKVLREWATMYRRIAPGLYSRPVSERVISNEEFVDRLATLALGVPSIAHHVKQWAEDTGRVNHLFAPLSAGQTNCSDIRHAGLKPAQFARIGDRLFISHGYAPYIEAIDLSSLTPNQIMEVPIPVEFVVAVPDTEDLVVGSFGRLIRISSVTWEVIWETAFAPSRLGGSNVVLAANKTFIAYQTDNSPEIVLFDVKTGKILRRGIQLEEMPLNWILKPLQKLFAFFSVSSLRISRLILATPDGELFAVDQQSDKVYRWADPINKPKERSTITNFFLWKLWWKRASRRVLTFLMLVALVIIILKITTISFEVSYQLKLVIVMLVSLPISYYLSLEFKKFPTAYSDLGSLCGMTQTPERELVLAYGRGILFVVDGITGRVIRILETGTENAQIYLSGIAALDDTRIAIAKENGRCEVWNIDLGKRDLVYGDNANNILSISASSQDVILMDSVYKIRRWLVDLDTSSNEKKTMPMRTLAVARSPDGRRWAITSHFSSCHLWNLDKTNEAPTQLIHDLGFEHGPAFTHDGSAVVLIDTSASRFLIWDITAGRYTSLNGNHLWCWPTAEYWSDVPSFVFLSLLLPHTLIQIFKRRWWSLRVSKHPKRNLSVACDTTSLGLYWPKLLANYPIFKSKPLLHHYHSQVASNAMFPNLIVAGGSAGDLNTETTPLSNEGNECVVLLNTVSGDTRVLRGNGASVKGIAITKEGHIVVLDKQGLWLWTKGVDSKDVKPIKLCETRVDEREYMELYHEARYFSYGEDRWIAVQPEIGFIDLWDIDQGKLIKKWDLYPNYDRYRHPRIAATNDGRVVTVGDDKMVDLWDVISDTPVASYPLTQRPEDLRIIDDLVVIITYAEGLTVLKLPPKQLNKKINN
jgi:WD40 repeat protein